MSQPAHFLDFVFEDGRFTGHTVPVEALDELVTLQRLIKCVAQHLYLADHPARKNLPRGFAFAGRLSLVATEANCFTACVNRATSDPFGAYYDQGRDLTIDALAAAQEKKGIPSTFPIGAADLMLDLGKRLEGKEFITLRSGPKASPSRKARVDLSTRMFPGEQLQKPATIVDSIEGEVIAVARDRGFLTARTESGAKYEVPFGDGSRELVDRIWNSSPIARVSVSGTREGRRFLAPSLEIQATEHPRAPEIEKLWKRLDELSQLKAGWLGNDDGHAISGESVLRAKWILSRLLADDASVAAPSVFPTPEGCIQAEWRLGDWSAEVRFPESRSDFIYAEASGGMADDGEYRQFRADEVTSANATELTSWLAAIATKGAK